VFDAARSVTQATRGGLVTVTIEWRDPKQAADWANLLVQRLNSEMRARAIASTDKSVSYLEKELGATSTLGTQQAINRLIETQVNQRMLANVTQEYTFRVVDKALPPEPDDKIGPSKILLIALGFGIGLVFGMFAILVFNMLTANRAAAAKS
jgi:LPS O-antigen subunit length determinant protein (WzzB/FepE family)